MEDMSEGVATQKAAVDALHAKCQRVEQPVLPDLGPPTQATATQGATASTDSQAENKLDGVQHHAAELHIFASKTVHAATAYAAMDNTQREATQEHMRTTPAGTNPLQAFRAAITKSTTAAPQDPISEWMESQSELATHDRNPLPTTHISGLSMGQAAEVRNACGLMREITVLELRESQGLARYTTDKTQEWLPVSSIIERPPPPQAQWSTQLQAGDHAELRKTKGWHRVKVQEVDEDGLIKVQCPKSAETWQICETELRPAAKQNCGEFSYQAGGQTYCLEPPKPEPMACVRLVGLSQRTFNGLEGTLHTWLEARGRWTVSIDGHKKRACVQPANLQVLRAAPPPPPAASAVAETVLCGWLKQVQAETAAMADALQDHGPGLWDTLKPKATEDPALQEAYRQSRRNFANVDELREAINKMTKGKTGRSLAVEHLLGLEDEELRQWLTITAMIFAGEAVDEIKLGTVAPQPKDHERFRPITLLEPIYKACMAWMSSCLLRLLFDHKLLDESQYGFVLDGSCIEPLSIVNTMYEHARAQERPLHCVFLDATSAFDSVPHTALAIALRRLGAPEDYITWLRSMLNGHHCAVKTSYDVSDNDEAQRLGAGTPQGCPASPVVWALIVDLALSYAAAAGGLGYELDNADMSARVRNLAYADDLSGFDGDHEGLRRTVQALIVAMAAVGVRFNADKSYYCWSLAAQPGGVRPPPMKVYALTADGCWKLVELTPVPPIGDPNAKTLAGRGVVRYLGVHFSFEGCGDGDRWSEQKRILQRKIDSFFARCNIL